MTAWIVFVMLGTIGYLIADYMHEEEDMPLQIKWAVSLTWVLFVLMIFEAVV